MDKLLEAMLGGGTLEQLIEKGGERIRRVGSEAEKRRFRVSRDDGFATVQLYPRTTEGDKDTYPFPKAARAGK